MASSTTITTQSAGGIILNPYSEIAMVNQHGNSWSFPKGHLEQNESLLDAAIREITEETGLVELEFIDYLGSYQRYKIGLNGTDNQSELKDIHFYFFKSEKSLLAPTDPDNPEAKWIAIDQAASLLTHPKDKLFFESIIRSLR